MVQRTLRMLSNRPGRKGAQRGRVAHQRASALERRIESFVRIERDRIGQVLFDHSLFNGHPRFFGYM